MYSTYVYNFNEVEIIKYVDKKILVHKCSWSRQRPQKVDKRMVLEHTHGLFIT